MYADSPLRYPGGKGRVANFIKLLCIQNNLVGGHYAEPYAGGGSVALALLFAEVVNAVHINDIDPGLVAFWEVMLTQTDRLCEQIESVPLTITEWRRQQAIQRSASARRFERGFATFYLNRTNRSGIIGSGGVIGGLAQSGKWKMDARFNRSDLVDRIRKISRYRNRIHVTQLDAIHFLESKASQLPPKSLVYLDPPYYVKGQGLYPNYYEAEDHASVAAVVESLNVPWLVSYDNVDPIRALYSKHRVLAYDLRYSAQERYEGREVMFFCSDLNVPNVANPACLTADRFRRALTEASFSLS